MGIGDQKIEIEGVALDFHHLNMKEGFC